MPAAGVGGLVGCRLQVAAVFAEGLGHGFGGWGQNRARVPIREGWTAGSVGAVGLFGRGISEPEFLGHLVGMLPAVLLAELHQQPHIARIKQDGGQEILAVSALGAEVAQQPAEEPG